MLVLCQKLHICIYDRQNFFRWPASLHGPLLPHWPPKMEVLEPPLPTSAYKLVYKIFIRPNVKHYIMLNFFSRHRTHGVYKTNQTSRTLRSLRYKADCTCYCLIPDHTGRVHRQRVFLTPKTQIWWVNTESSRSIREAIKGVKVTDETEVNEKMYRA